MTEEILESGSDSIIIGPVVDDMNTTSSASSSSSSNQGAPLVGVKSISVNDIVDFTISARESFEVFMGRRYDPAESLLDAPALLLAQDACVPGSAAAERFTRHLTTQLGNSSAAVGSTSSSSTRRSGGGGNAAALASPLARYTRLLIDLQALQAELNVVAADDAAKGTVPPPHNTTSGGGGGGIYRILTDGVAHIAQELESLRIPAENAAATVTPPIQSHATVSALRALANESTQLLSRVVAAELIQKELNEAAKALAARVNNVNSTML